MSKTAKVFIPMAVVCVLFAIVLSIVGYNMQGNEEMAGEGEGQGEDHANVEAGEMPDYIKTNCTSCHGQNLEGAFGPNLHNLDLSKEEIIDVLKNGKGQMPPQSAIAGKEEEAAEYLLSLKE